MSASTAVQNLVSSVVPIWLSNRLKATVGYSFMLGVATFFDALIDQSIEGVRAAWPGSGTNTADPHIGLTRGLVQGLTETSAHFEVRLQNWIETHAGDRTLQLAMQIHEFLPGNPRVTIISRAKPAITGVAAHDPHWIVVQEDGTFYETDSPWDWDSVSNPERVNCWSDLWIVIYSSMDTYPSVYPFRAGTLGGLTGEDGYGLGLYAPRADAQNLKAIIQDWKGAHSNIRCVIWTTSPSFGTPGSLSNPDGYWGQWSDPSTPGSRVASPRNLTTCRFWAPNQ